MIINTPKELMQSRYEAFVKEDWDYIVKTSLHQTLQEFENYQPMQWLRLDIVDAYDNIVEFKAYYMNGEKIEVLHEKSSFVQIDGVWKYQNGELFNSKIKRNISCPCGSGKKYKKCCY